MNQKENKELFYAFPKIAIRKNLQILSELEASVDTFKSSQYPLTTYTYNYSPLKNFFRTSFKHFTSLDQAIK
jgi:hypothetical protein